MNINDHWEIQPSKRGIAGTIGLRADLSWWKRLYIIWIQKKTVVSLYRDIQHWLYNNMSFSDAMTHGNFKATDEIRKKVQTVFQMQEGWSINPNSTRALMRGPLLNSEGTMIIVPVHGKFVSLMTMLEELRVYQITVSFGVIIGLLWALIEATVFFFGG